MLIVCVIVSYLLGTLSTGYLLTRFVFINQNIDFRHIGASAILEKTNTKTASFVILVDFIKGLAYGLLLLSLFPSPEIKNIFHYCVIGMITGHVFPFQKRNKGGRGVIISAGLLYSIIPLPMLIGSVFIIGIKLLFKDSALAVFLSMPIITTLTYFLPINYQIYKPNELVLFICLPIMIILIYKRISPKDFSLNSVTKQNFINRIFYDRD